MSIQLVRILLAAIPVASLTTISAPNCLARMAQDKAQSSDMERFDRTFPMNAGGTLSVENRKGTVHITGSDSGTVVVSVHKYFEGSDKDRAWWLAKTKVNFENEPSRVSVVVDYPDFNCRLCHNVSYGVELEITVPRKTNVVLRGNKPEMLVSAINGDIRITSQKSPISISSTNGSIEIETSKGNVRLSDVAIRGRLELNSEKADAVIEARSLEGSADLETEKGSIIIRVPANLGADVEYIGGRRSEFRTDFPLTAGGPALELESTRGRINNRSSHITGKLNQGGAKLILRTSRGSVSIERSS